MDDSVAPLGASSWADGFGAGWRPAPAGAAGTERVAGGDGSSAANPDDVTVKGGNREDEGIGGVGQGLLFKNPEGNLVTHAEAVVVVAEVVDASHVSANGDIGCELVELTFQGQELIWIGGNQVSGGCTLAQVGARECGSAEGNGLISSVMATLREAFGVDLEVVDYTEHALGKGTDARAAAYLECRANDGRTIWGCGIDEDIATASVRAVLSAANGTVCR